MHEGDVSVGQRDRDPGRNQRPLPRLQRHVDRCHQVGPGVTGVGVGRQRQVGVQPGAPRSRGRECLLTHAGDPTWRRGSGRPATDRSGAASHVRPVGPRASTAPLPRAARGTAAMVGAGDDAGRQPVAGGRRRAARTGGLGDHRDRDARCSRSRCSPYGDARVVVRDGVVPCRPGPHPRPPPRRGRGRWMPSRPAGSQDPRPTHGPTCCCAPTSSGRCGWRSPTRPTRRRTGWSARATRTRSATALEPDRVDRGVAERPATPGR